MCVTAARIAAAALDPHDVSVEVLSVGAVEAQQHGVGQGGRAAAAVSASPTGARAVAFGRPASGKANSDGLLGPDGSLTLLPLLDGRNRGAIKMTS